jgi:hypothetical protein
MLSGSPATKPVLPSDSTMRVPRSPGRPVPRSRSRSRARSTRRPRRVRFEVDVVRPEDRDVRLEAVPAMAPVPLGVKKLSMPQPEGEPRARDSASPGLDWSVRPDCWSRPLNFHSRIRLARPGPRGRGGSGAAGLAVLGSSMVFGQSSFKRTESARSLRSFPSVWQRGRSRFILGMNDALDLRAAHGAGLVVLACTAISGRKAVTFSGTCRHPLAR